MDLFASRLLCGSTLLLFPDFSKSLLDPYFESPKKNPQDKHHPEVSKSWLKLYGIKDVALGLGSLCFVHHPIHLKFLMQIGVLLDGGEVCLAWYLYFRGRTSRRVTIGWTGKVLHSFVSGMVWSGLFALLSMFKKQPKIYQWLDNFMFYGYVVIMTAIDSVTGTGSNTLQNSKP